MARQKIAIDVDDTLFDHFADLAKCYSQQFDTVLTLADNHPKTEESLKAWNAASVEEAVCRVHRFYDTKEFKEAVPYDHALNAIPALSQSYDLVFITARDMEVLEKFTNEWLSKHFGGHYQAVHFTAQYSLSGKSRSKLEVCESEGVSYLVDDSLENCVEVAKNGIRALLYGEYPWNLVDPLPDNITRVANWDDVLKVINAE